MPDGIRIQVDDRELQLFIGAASALAGDTTPLMRQLGAYVESTSKLRFRSGTGPGGVAWQPSIRARTEGGRTLRQTGALRDSIRHEASRDKVAIGPAGGPAAVYAGVHQHGATIRAKAAPYLTFRIAGRFVSKREVTIPARPFMGVDQADATAIRSITVDYLAAALPRGRA